MGKILEIKKISDLLNGWAADDNGIKAAFIEIVELLESLEGLVYSFKSRPGISHSLRASIDNREKKLLTLMDIIDDDPANRWTLSRAAWWERTVIALIFLKMTTPRFPT